MDKKQLANTIWQAANAMRGNLEANDYKDFILGFMFYKFLSDQEVNFFVDRGLQRDQLESELDRGNKRIDRYIDSAKENIGYFIEYKDLFSTWIKKGNALEAEDVTEALVRFQYEVAPAYQAVFDEIFKSFTISIGKLDSNPDVQAKQLIELIKVVRRIPTDGKQDYDVLGYIYEFLIGKFAASAGQSNGEFYTPHQVALVMAELVAEHHKGRKTLQVYDPTSGSASLLLNIGESIARRNGDKNMIKYYAQEKMTDAYNITRMNLVMRGVKPDNISTRQADSLEQDWPRFNEFNEYELLRVDAVVSNPPYSAKWSSTNKENDPRFADYGLAPETKADYAFLLHELYHLEEDGILTIVLPHGVLFRGGDEEAIRTRLIEKNNIDTIIGFPPNVFFGTGIATIVMVLKKNRGVNDDVLFVDASKGFVKVGKKNELRARDVRRIVDVVTERREEDKFSRRVSRDEIRENGYNLNIPRYVDSSADPENWDIYATMFGGIPQNEIDGLHKFWDNLPRLREAVFASLAGDHTQVRNGADLAELVENHPSVKQFYSDYAAAMDGLDVQLYDQLVDGWQDLDLNVIEADLRQDLFDRLRKVEIIDEYEGYEHFSHHWASTFRDLEILQADGWESTTTVSPVEEIKVDKDGNVQEPEIVGYEGKILPFALIQREMFGSEFEKFTDLQARLAAVESTLAGLFEQIDKDDYGAGDSKITNKGETKFAKGNVKKRVNQLLENVETEETLTLAKYLDAGNKKARDAFVVAHPEVNWDVLPTTKTGLFTKPSITARIAELKRQEEFEEGSLLAALIKAEKALDEQTTLKAEAKAIGKYLEEETYKTIQNLNEAQVKDLLRTKWVGDMLGDINAVPPKEIAFLVDSIKALQAKYSTTLADVNAEIVESQSALAGMMSQLTGSDTDMEGIAALQDMFGREK